MIKKITRTNDDLSDKNLSETEFRNVHKLLKDHTAIQKVKIISITDGDSGQIHKKHLGKARNSSTLELLDEHLMKNRIIVRNLHKEDNKLIFLKKGGGGGLNSKIIRVFVLYNSACEMV
jgi:hypothetical protein